MIRSRTISNFIVFFLLSIGLSVPMQGQETKVYKGPYKVGKYVGKANFQYQLSDSDTIFNGSFQMQHSNLDALLQKQDTTFSFKGHFSNNRPDGKWNFKFGNFQTDSLTELVGLQYQLKVSGTQKEASGVISNGKPHGEWLYTINHIKDSEIDQTSFKSAIIFDNGVPQKSFKITTNSGTLLGRFLRDGLAHDEWVLYAENNPQSSESWVFNNGLLEKVILENSTERKEITIFDTNTPQTKTIQLDDRYLDILGFKSNVAATSITFKNGIRKALLQNYSYYKDIDTILNTLGESTFLPEFKVKVPHYPLTANDNAQLDSISKLVQNAVNTSDTFLNDTQLLILKASDTKANYLFNALSAINDTYLHPLSKFNSYHQRSTFEFVDRNAIIKQLWPNGFPQKQLAVAEAPNKPFSGPNADIYNFSEVSLETVHQIASYASASIETIKTELEGKLMNEKRAQELISVEEAMIAQINRLNKLIDSVGNSHPKKQINALKNIKVVANANLSSYSNISNKEEKLKVGRQLINCFTDLQLLENAIIQLPQQQNEIEVTYQDQIWNPFMANLMTEEVKKRIKAAYGKVILPHLLESTTANLECSNAKDIAFLFENTHKRMLELRDLDTRKLERKLRKEREPAAVMQLLNITKVAAAE